jgi:ferredoxin-NADP reductase
MKQTVKLLEQKVIAKDTVEFVFSRPEGFAYRAGQSIDLYLINPPETDDEGNKRAFSLTSAPFEEHLMIATRMRNTAFKRVLKNMQPGTELSLDGPFGSFTLHNDAAKPAVFLTGGIGITPVHSMIEQAMHEKLPHKMILFYSNHTPNEAAFMDELNIVAAQNSNFTFVPTMTQAQGTDWKGKAERISEDMIKEYVPDVNSAIYYLCGPASMVSLLKQTLINAGVNEDNIRSEDFTGY